MVYVSAGGIQSQRSMWRVSFISESFWGLINFIVLFFKTMVQPDLTKHGRGLQSNYSAKPNGGDDSGPRRRMGGFKRSTGPSPPPAAGGG
uniref:Selenoprotein K n=2 Tax=Ciona intestinalis TaxID=7719 RepID=H2XU60_CIOIN